MMTEEFHGQVNMSKRICIVDKVCTVLLMIFVVLSSVGTYFENYESSQYTYFAFATTILAFFLSLYYHPEKNDNISTEVTFYVLLTILGFMSTMVNGNAELSYLLWNLKYYFVAMTLYRICIWAMPIRILFWGFVAYLGEQILLGTNIRLLTLNVSRNIISIHLLILFVFYALALYNQHKEHRLWIPLIMSSVIVLWTGCRSGIVAFLTLIVGLFLCTFRSEKSVTRRGLSKHPFIIIVLVVLASIALIAYIVKTGKVDYIFQMLNEKNGITILSDSRFEIIKESLSACIKNPIYLLFGPNFSTIHTVTALSGNPHNSFIFGYGHYGLIFLIYVMVRFATSIVSFMKKRSIWGFVLIAIVVRIFSDSTAFYGILDPIIFYFIFEYFLSAPNHIKVIVHK